MNLSNGITVDSGVTTATASLGVGLSGATTIDVEGGTLKLTGGVTGTSGLTKVGDGTLALSGSGVNYTGNTTVEAGTLRLKDATNFSNGTGVADTITIDSGATLNFAVDQNVSSVALGTTGGTTITGAGTLEKSGSGLLTVGGPSGDQVDLALSAGTVHVAAGTLELAGVEGTADASAAVVSSGATLDLDGTAATLGTFSGTGTLTDSSTTAASSLTVGAGDVSSIFNGAIAGNVSLTKLGTGTLTLGGTNTYTGSTVIAAGKMTFDGGTGGPAPLDEYTLDGTLGASTSGATLADSGTADNPMTAGWGNGYGTFIAGQYGQAVEFPGNLGTGYSSAYNVSSYTVSEWINVSDGGGGGIFTTRESWGTNQGVDQYYYQSGGQLDTEFYATGSGWVTLNLTGVNLQSGWNMITTAVGAGTWSIYVNGTPVSGGTGTYSGDAVLMQPGNTFYLGTTEAAAFTGGIDDFRVYGAALTASQVASLYNWNGTSTMGSLPSATALSIAAGATFDLGGSSQTVASLADYNGGGGKVINNGTAAATLTLAPVSGSTTFSGTIKDGTGTVALTLDGAGTQVFAGSDTYSGLTTIIGGTLQIGAGGSTGAIKNSSGVVDDGTLAFNRSGTVDFAPAISGTGGLVQMGPGTLALDGTATYTGSTTISGGTLDASSAGSPVSPVVHYSFDGTLGPIAPNATIADSSSNGINLTMRDSGASYVSGAFGQAVSMPSGIYMYTPATSALTSLNSWTDSVWIDIPAADINNNQGLVTATNPDGNGFETFYDAADHSIYLLRAQQSEQCLGGLRRDLRCPRRSTADTWHMITTTITSSGVNLYVDGQYVGNQTNLFNGQAWDSSQTPQFMNADSNLSIGEGPRSGWTESAALDEFSLYGSVLTPVQIAQLYDTNSLTPVGSLPSGTAVTVSGTGVLDLLGNQTVSSLSGDGKVTATAGAATLTLTNATGTTSTFSGHITDTAGGSLSLVLDGPGTQILSGTDSYDGSTTVVGGTLQLRNSSALPSTTALTVAAGATVDLRGHSETVASLSGAGTVTDGRTVAASLTRGARQRHHQHLQRRDPKRQRHGVANHQRQRHGHGNPRRPKHVYGHDDDQRRHAAIGRRNRCQRFRGGRHR